MTSVVRLQRESYDRLAARGETAPVRPPPKPFRSSPQQLLSMPAGSGPLYLQIYHRIRGLIISGAWRPGTRLPSSRALARDLGISRNTAILALDKLMADGWIQARAGSGIYVSFEAPPPRQAPAILLSSEVEVPPTPVPFGLSYGAIDLFPIAEWGKIQSRVWTRLGGEALLEGSGSGWLPLRQAIAGYLHAVRGMVCSPEQILIMSSTRAAVDLTVRVLGRPGDGIWMEDPGCGYAREAFKPDQLHEAWVPVDAAGMNVALAKSIAPDARFAYVSPACQFPTGTILSEARRTELLDWAARHGGIIIEDDRDFNAVFGHQHPPEPMAASAPDDVVFIHSFNRLLFPALRIAALVVPPHLAERFVEARFAIEGFPNTANQIALADFIERGLLSAFLRKCKFAYEQRREALHAGIKRYLSDWLWVDERQPGLAAVAFTRGAKAADLTTVAGSAGIACKSLGEFRVDRNSAPEALVLGFGPFSSELIDDAIGQLASALRAH